MKPRAKRGLRIGWRRLRLRVARDRDRFNAWAVRVQLGEWLACAAMGAVLGLLIGWGY